jgi:hypothetical protein
MNTYRTFPYRFGGERVTPAPVRRSLASYTPRSVYPAGGMQDKPHPQTAPPQHQKRQMPHQKREERALFQCVTKRDSATTALVEKR